MEISPYTRVEKYPMRGSAARVSDWIEVRERRINGKRFEFTRVHWAHGDVTVRAWQAGTTNLLHEWEC